MNECVFRPAWRSFYWHVIGISATFILASVLSLKIELGDTLFKGVWFFCLLLMSFTFMNMAYKRLSSTLAVKKDKITFDQGIIGRHSLEIALKNIRTIQVNQSLMQRILNVGEILLTASGAEAHEISIKNMPEPSKIRSIMQLNESCQEEIEEKIETEEPETEEKI